VPQSTWGTGALRSNLRFCFVLFLAAAADGLLLLYHYASMAAE